ncbi:MAG: ABC transporter permease [Candidatus Cloacimonadaceae bacterium]|nr:ABC transporter permease [Candidatus Cloacimonadota bacterium]MDY0380569.1 ABC transporter permease [Candidatus Cloacimonadaceae bacterium]MCB5264382.1 ABC transporter permease [Candidatus Cloacimonadota bacterium]MCB5277090.1 ABC transporter permease [Candidatus Cloacimonadota bacterium]MDD2719132.1 ABC transporter permease [Candidatus Cloacimonadota bacterium]
MKKSLLPLGFLLILLAIWHIISSKAVIAFWIIPNPKAVMEVFTQSHELIWHHLKPTLTAAISGLLISIVIGSLTAILMDVSKLFKQIIYPYLVVSQTVPIIAVAPLIIIWFGYGISAKVFTVVLVCFFPIALGMFEGFQQVTVDQLRLMKALGASGYKCFRYLKLPAGLPGFFTGLKLAATYSVMGAVIGEWLGGKAGLGIYMTRATKSFHTAHVFAVIIVIILLSMTLFGIVALLDRFFLRWRYQHMDEYVEPKKTQA